MNKKLNVLHLISSLEVGGAEKLLIELLKNTKAQDINFVVVVMNNNVDEGLKQELLGINSNVYFLNRIEGHKHPKYLFQLLKVINKHKVNIIHTHNYGSKIWASLCKFVFPGLKLVYTIHSSNTIKKMNTTNIVIHNMFVDKSIAISEEIYQGSKNKKMNSIKIYNGVEVDKYKINQNKNVNKYFNIINVGRITHSVKGQDILIKALKECKNKGINFVCNFVGGVYSYDKESFEYLKDLVNDLELSKNINFLGNRNDVPKLLTDADLFVLPSRYEGMPVSLLEAMASNLPVIASNISGSNDLISNGENGLLFESENVQDLADKIQYLYENKNIREELVQNAYKFVQGFDISTTCKNYCELYKSLY